MLANGTAPITAIRGPSPHRGRSAHFTSTRAEQSILSELALAWRPHPTLTHRSNVLTVARTEKHAHHSPSVGSPPRRAADPRKGVAR